ncbi:MAG: methyl-accepting chemotaxis protein, partial [Porphyrobacter sp.]|nr:methyl-accepting chemotaxis protein [Porphyrobacter sp.]
MIAWFQKIAPIRIKFDVLIALCLLAAGGSVLFAWLGYAGLVEPLSAMIGVAVAALVPPAALRFAKERICAPYVETVVRMEQLAAGDCDSPFPHADHRDCVGRMTVAMGTFREEMRAGRARAAEQGALVETLTGALARLAAGDLTCRIAEMPEGEHMRLQETFNASMAKLEAMIAAVRATVGGVRTGSDEIRAASEDLALRNEQQAASLEETAASVGAV